VNVLGGVGMQVSLATRLAPSLTKLVVQFSKTIGKDQGRTRISVVDSEHRRVDEVESGVL
jgi:hypothetical protein